MVRIHARRHLAKSHQNTFSFWTLLGSYWHLHLTRFAGGDPGLASSPSGAEHTHVMPIQFWYPVGWPLS